MNYRHAFHAGNFADVFKHIALVRVLEHLRRKEAPFRAIDTHAGIGLYDVGSDEATRTGEWRSGVGRMDEAFGAAVKDLIAPYRRILEAVRARHGATILPGSPQVIRELLRWQDRAVLVELHPEDGATLSERFNAVANIKVLRLDGWTALNALVPPPERRGLVLIDPPFEDPGEFERLRTALTRAIGKWPTGILMAWYPIKDLREVSHAAEALAGGIEREALRLELLVDEPNDPRRLNGCGMFVLNPPWKLEEEMRLILPALAERLARAGYGGYRCERLA